MSEEEKQAIDILKNSIADYVIGEYCEKCADNKICNDRNEDCYFIQAIDKVLNLIEKQQKQNEEVKKEKRILIEKYTDVVYECGKRSEVIEYLQKRLYRKGVFSKEKFVRFYPKQYQNEYVKNWVNESDGLTPREMEELGYDVLEECLI